MPCGFHGNKTTLVFWEAKVLNRISTYLYRHPRLVLGLLLGPPMLYMGVVYLGSLFSLLINSFFYLEEFKGLVVREFT